MYSRATRTKVPSTACASRFTSSARISRYIRSFAVSTPAYRLLHMSNIILDDNVLDRLRDRYPQYQETVYLFVLSSLHHVIEQLPEPRHITEPELASGVRDLALARFGPMARTVLEHWGVHATQDVGQIVFAL